MLKRKLSTSRFLPHQRAAFSKCACLQALSLINFPSRLKALTKDHTRGGMFQAVCSHLLPKTCPPPARRGWKKAAFYLLRLSWYNFTPGWSKSLGKPCSHLLPRCK